MSAEENTPDSEVPDAEPTPQPGAMLKAAREDAKLSEEYVAREMSMTVTKVRALEADDYERLHSDIFIRGYLRTYAKLLGMDPAPVLEAYQAHRRAAGFGDGPEESPLQINVPAQNRSLWKFAIWILLLLAGIWALSVWFLGNRPMSSEPVGFAEPMDEAPSTRSSATSGEGAIEGTATQTAAVTNLDSAPVSETAAATRTVEDRGEPSASDAAGPAPNMTTDAAREEISAASSVPDNVEPLAASRAAEPAAEFEAALDELQLSFSDECWVEVTDSRGDVLETNLFQAGRDLTLNGEAPFTVKLGNSSAVDVVLNGEAFEFTPPSNGRLMTLTVSANP
ncbi:RodZ domain-containing protein [Marinimicrobium sp. ARAG 43.8]|uniref:RodZ domain-containing protein n=1 Tax=Marinimicrobium sp. ARAG 43.8 TaxID=3418719 RepID=UPI003CF20955